MITWAAIKRPQKRAHTIPLLFVFVFLLSVLAQFIAPAITYAAPASPSEATCKVAGGVWKNLAPAGGVPKMGCSGASTAAQQSLDWQVKSLLFYRSVGDCFIKNTNASISREQVQSSEITQKAGVLTATGPYLDKIGGGDGDGIAGCSGDQGKALMKAALSHWGISATELLCGAGYTWSSIPNDKNRCVTATPDDNDSMALGWEDRGTRKGTTAEQRTKAVLSYLKNTFYNGQTPELSKAGWYYFYRNIFFQKCSTTQKQGQGSTTRPSVPNSRDVSFYDVDQSGDPVQRWYRLDQDMVNRSFTTRNSGEMAFSDVNRTCEQIASNHLNQANALEYAKFAQASPPDTTAPPNTPGGTSGDEEDATATSCNIEGIGWMVCPVITFLAFMTDTLYNWIQNFLVVQPLNVNTGAGDNTTFIAWSAMQNIANVAFVIAFLIIIFSQLTGAGVSNYGVKKMLPRLVVAAILVNTSYWIAAIAVDISNVFGSAIYTFLREGIPLGDVTIGTNMWENIALLLLSGGAMGGAVIAGGAVISAGTIAALGPVALYAFIVFILGVALALIIAFLVLAVRQALIIILIVIAPLAFVAMILPNTEKYFGAWRKTLFTLLVFYPLFSLLFGGSYLAGMIIIGSAGQANDNSANGMLLIIGLAITAIPLFLTPMIMKFSTGVLGQVAGMVNNRSKGLIDRARNVRNRKAGLAMHETLGSSKAKAQRNPFARMYRRSQNDKQVDADRQKIIDSGNKAAYMSSDRGAQILTDVGNAGDVVSTLETEQKATFDAQRSGDLAYRKQFASQQSEVFSQQDKARYEESKTSNQQLIAQHPLGVQAKALQREADLVGSQVSSAKGVQQQDYAEALSADPSLAARAGGVAGPRGASRVTAAAVSAIDEADAKAVKAEAVIMENTGMSDVLNARTGATEPGLATIARNPSATIDQRAAAVGRIANVGSDDNIYETLDYLASMPDSEEKITLQKQFAGEVAKRKPYSIGAADFTNLSQGKYSGTFTEKVVGRIQGGKLSAGTVVGGSADELKRIIKAADDGNIARADAHYIQLKTQIQSHLANPNAAQPSQEILDLIAKL